MSMTTEENTDRPAVKEGDLIRSTHPDSPTMLVLFSALTNVVVEWWHIGSRHEETLSRSVVDSRRYETWLASNCTDDNEKPHTLDGATTSHLDDLDLTAPDGYAWSPHGALIVLYDEDFRRVAEVARSEDESHPWVYMLKNTLPSHGFDDIRNAMSAAERAAVDIAENQFAESIMKKTGVDVAPATIKPRCPLHVCDIDSRICGRESYDREACSETVQGVVVPSGEPKSEGYRQWARDLKRDEPPAIEVVDARPAESHIDRLNRCQTMLLKISEEALADIFTHLCAIVEVEAVE